MKGMVLVDASPLIGLSIVNGLGWLQQLFDTVYIPESVKREVLSGRVTGGEQAIRKAIDEDWLLVWCEAAPNQLEFDLDQGETDCINIALAQEQAVLLMMDERAGRAVALEKGLNITGTAAIIGTAKQQGLIDSAREVFEVLHQSDFRISAEVIRQVLVHVGEV